VVGSFDHAERVSRSALPLPASCTSNFTDHQRPSEETGSPRGRLLSDAAVALFPATMPGDCYRAVSPTPSHLSQPMSTHQSQLVSSGVNVSPAPNSFLDHLGPSFRAAQNFRGSSVSSARDTRSRCPPLQVDASQKPPRKGLKVPRSEVAIVQITPRDTIIFSKGGGQPSDIGYIL
jgi:hypothetical protein